MSMARGPSDADAGDAKLSWREREVVAALKRLANAQLQVARIDEKLVDQVDVTEAVVADPADVAELEATVAELARLAKRSQSLFGGGSARGRSADLEAAQRRVLDRMGFATYDDYLAATASSAPAPDGAPGIDPVVEEFARRELAAAEAAYRELLLLPDDAESDDDGAGHDGGSGDDDGSVPTIDLTG